MDQEFHAIQNLKMPEEIVRHIRSMIKKGRLNPGQKLPSERNLAQMLGVGRSTLREAMKTLSTLGFSEIKERRGAFVKSLGAVMIPDTVTQLLDQDRSQVKDLYDLRMDLEVGAAFMAAKNRTIDDLHHLERLLTDMESQIDAPRLGIDVDIRFHLAIARASGNVLRHHVLENLFDRYGHYIDVARRPFLKGPSHNQAICSHHRNLFSAIQAKQPQVAQKAMQEHLLMVRAQWQ